MRGEDAAQSHEPHEEETADLRPRFAIAAAHFAIFGIVDLQANVVPAFAARERIIFDEDLLLVHRRSVGHGKRVGFDRGHVGGLACHV